MSDTFLELAESAYKEREGQWVDLRCPQCPHTWTSWGCDFGDGFKVEDPTCECCDAEGEWI